MTNSVSDVGKKATVENEDGETLEVLYDPILKCYYEPKSNTYYELNWLYIYYFNYNNNERLITLGHPLTGQ